jgi:hypothetical protein
MSWLDYRPFHSMRIAFVCSSLEPGCDGVGDYTHALAAECASHGHKCILLALNDRFVTQPAEREVHDSGLRMMRLPSSANWDQRIREAASYVKRFQPDCVSLQFVAYGFHPKGLAFGLATRLKLLMRGFKSHVMFHELWIGESTGYGLKDRAVGFLQKRGVLRLLRTIKPSVMHTSNPVYVEILKRNGIEARELPLPGSIPLVEADTEWWEATMRMQTWGLEGVSRSACWIAGIFGTIHPQWSAGAWLDRLCEFAREKGRRLLLLHIGHSAEAGRAVWNRCAQEYSGRCDFVDLGAQVPERISTVLQALDFGVATSPWALIGKSSSVSSMLDHGVPVVVTRDDWKLLRGLTPAPTAQRSLFRFGEDFLKQLGEGLERVPAQSRCADVTRQFLDDLASMRSLSPMAVSNPDTQLGLPDWKH